MTQLHQAVEDLAANRMTSNLLPPHQFLECVLCRSVINGHIRPNCPTELLLKEKITLCTRKLISGLKSLVLIRTPTRWIYTTSGEAKVVLNCIRRDAGLNVSTTILKGVGEIPNRDGCDLIADGYRIPARFFGSSWHSSDFGKITFPEVDGIYSKEETDLLNQDVNDTLKIIQEFYDQLGTVSVSVEVTERHPEATRTDAELGDLGKSIVPNEQTIRESNQPERECVPKRSGIIA
ncbi:hypothetical protein J6590_073967 [Homalodisca vitripennis]|nr:hypothetical protein J6590_073967 [Homalodisca vitripennis]